MAVLLHIEASARAKGSHTRHLGRLFIDRWLASRPEDRVIARDVGRHPPAPVNEAWIAAAFTKPEQRSPTMRGALGESDALVDEIEQADLIVAGVPMYNFGVPAGMKAYIDNIVRIGRTFGFDRSRPDNPYSPMLGGRKMVILSARGDYGYAPGERMSAFNHVEPHLRSVFSFMGVEVARAVAVEYDEFGDERFAGSLIAAEDEIEQAVHALTRTLEPSTIPAEHAVLRGASSSAG